MPSPKGNTLQPNWRAGLPMSVQGQSQLGSPSWRYSHVRNAPLATVGPKKAACRDGPGTELDHQAARVYLAAGRGVFAHADMSGSSCCQRAITPATAAPRMGASQNSHSCAT